MATDHVSIRALRRRLRSARKAVRLLDQELMVLTDGIPCPSGDELRAMLSRKAPLTLEALLVGLVNLGQFHVEEAEETLTLALMASPRSLNSDFRFWWLRSDLRQSLANVLAGRTRKGKAAPHE